MPETDQKRRAQEALRCARVALRSLSKLPDHGFNKAISLLENRVGNIIVTGVGKSGFIAQKMAATLTSLGHRAVYLSPLDALHGDSGIISKGDVIIVYSFSGESVEIIRLIRHIKDILECPIIAVTGSKKNKLARLSEAVVQTNILKEGDPLGLAPMASTTSSLVVGDMIASALTSPETFQKHHFARFHPSGNLGLSLKKVKDVMVGKTATPTVTEKDSFTNALHAMTEGKRGVVAVVTEKNKLVGIITDGDIRRIVLEYESPKTLLIKKVMVKSPKTISKEASLNEAIERMKKHKVTSLFVVNSNNILEGLLHIRHIIVLMN